LLALRIVGVDLVRPALGVNLKAVEAEPAGAFGFFRGKLREIAEFHRGAENARWANKPQAVSRAIARARESRADRRSGRRALTAVVDRGLRGGAVRGAAPA